MYGGLNVGFYLRKSFNFGPVRLNLSKSGLGVSAGIPGFRLGSGPRGSYLHAGREGLYYRKTLSTKKKNNQQSKVVQDSSSSIPAGSTTANTHSGQILLWIILGIVAIILLKHALVWLSGKPGLITGVAISFVAFFIVPAWNQRRYGGEIKRYKSWLERSFLDSTSSAKALVEEIPLISQGNLEAAVNLEKNLYFQLLEQVIKKNADWEEGAKKISSYEKATNLNSDFIRQAKHDAFHRYYLEAIVDQKITQEEMGTFKALIRCLNIPRNVIEDEIGTINDVVRMQSLKWPLPPLVDSSLRMSVDEVAYYSQPCFLPPDSNNDMPKIEGDPATITVTNKRIFILTNRKRSIDLKDIEDIDVDLDKSFVMIKLKGTTSETCLQSKEPFYLGKIIDLTLSHLEKP